MAEVIVIHMSTATLGDAGATIDIPQDGQIVGVNMNIAPLDLDTSGDSFRAELSFIATAQFTTNDARGIIASMEAVGLVEGTPGSAVNAAMQNHVNLQPDGIAVSGGERLFINSTVSTGVTGRITLDIYLRVGRRASPRRSRRRT